MPDMLRGRLPAIAAALLASIVGVILLVPTHPEAGILHLLASMLPPGTLAGGSPGWWTFEDLGNIALFVPVGLVASRYLRPASALVIGVGVSACCETAQLVIPGRTGSLQDVLMNTIGVAVGIAATLAWRHRSRQARATSPHSVQAQ